MLIEQLAYLGSLKGSVTHFQNSVGILERYEVIVM